MTEMIAMYVRVSSELQAKEQTVKSQIEALKSYACTHNYQIDSDMIFIDDGVSGKDIARPELDRLRDAAFNGLINHVLILCPDRLARKYSHQLILTDEFKGLGVQIEFMNRQISESPEDQLLLHVQGVIAEYEREKILERSRRGKLFKAKEGKVCVLGNSPYGYVYKKRENNSDGSINIDLPNAKIVRKIFSMYASEGKTLADIARKLTEDGVPTPTGTNDRWNYTVIGGMLKNAAYIGKAAFGKKSVVPSKKRSKKSRGTFNKTSSKKENPKSDWITIPIPAIIDETTFSKVQEKRLENSKFSKRNAKYHYLLSGLLYCEECGYVFVGRTATNSKNKNQYYYCNGKADRSFIKKRCTAKPIPGVIIDDLIWEEVRNLISNPQLVLNEYWSRVLPCKASGVEPGMHKKRKEKEIKVLLREKERILDLYQSDLMTRKEIESRINRIRSNISNVEEEIKLLQRSENEREKELHLIDELSNFQNKFSENLGQLDFDKKRKVIRLLVDSIDIDSRDTKVTINHMVPLNDKCRLSCTGGDK